jgi:cytochrome c oxidase subunit 2
MSPIRRANARGASRAALLLFAVVAAGCHAPMQMFSSASDSAERITKIAWFMIALAAIVYAIVIGAMVVATARNRRRAPSTVDMSTPGIRWIIIGGVILPALVFSAVFGVAETALGRYPDPRSALTINVTGHQWWWELEYALPQLSDHVKSANEIHIPAGVPVRLLVTTADVIHSFWVPQLQGKIDLIPGDTNDLRLMARKPGTYRGQCAEFCGAQHANMAITVIADDSATFARWLERQLADASPPTDSTLVMGQRLVVGGPCSLCHTVRGTPALGRTGPDLTHVGSRLTIAAGTLPNQLGTLEAWITNAQSIKPGAKMPALGEFTGQQLRAVAAYVASLK